MPHSLLDSQQMLITLGHHSAGLDSYDSNNLEENSNEAQSPSNEPRYLFYHGAKFSKQPLHNFSGAWDPFWHQTKGQIFTNVQLPM